MTGNEREEVRNHIRVLPPEEAKKIAAGEVIDRPAALVREFLDNAIDAGSTRIDLLIEEGGIRRTEVIDNGGGMEKADLELCWQPHATSKIRSLDDLTHTETLGFRGEALAAAAAVSHVEIVTSRNGRDAWRLEVGPGAAMEPRIETIRRVRGTTIRSLGLFDSIPARKRFLKRDASEAALCKQIFVDKALAFPHIEFRFTQDGKIKTILPPNTGYKERYGAVLLEAPEAGFLHEINTFGEGFSISIVVGGPELFRKDRKQQYIFANHRRIQDYGLMQALEYGLEGWYPNGTHPVGAVHIKIDPALADFNIHPAKREVRFNDPGVIHKAITKALKDFMHHFGVASNRSLASPEKNTDPLNGDGYSETQKGKSLFPGTSGRGYSGMERKPFLAGHERSSSLALEALLDNPPDFAVLPGRSPETVSEARYAYDRIPGEINERQHQEENGENPRGIPGTVIYRGRIFDLFILAEKDDRLFIIDQHAAHERILFDRFLSSPIPQQELLVPLPFETETAGDDRFLESHKEELSALGIRIEREDGHSWRLEALPVNWKQGDADTIKEILNLKNAGENMARRWAATLACHTAIKDKDYLDDQTALALAEAALELPVPTCPHGRPIWVEITKEWLFREVRRKE